jgi:hypothetical protein
MKICILKNTDIMNIVTDWHLKSNTYFLLELKLVNLMGHCIMESIGKQNIFGAYSFG